jgi:hypothetical protein
MVKVYRVQDLTGIGPESRRYRDAGIELPPWHPELLDPFFEPGDMYGYGCRTLADIALIFLRSPDAESNLSRQGFGVVEMEVDRIVHEWNIGIPQVVFVRRLPFTEDLIYHLWPPPPSPERLKRHRSIVLMADFISLFSAK